MVEVENTLDAEETKEPALQIVSPTGELLVHPIGSVIYIPYLNMTDDIYAVRKLRVESYGSNVDTEKWIVQIHFDATILEWDETEKMSMNILSSTFTSYEDASVELRNFLNRQITQIDSHSEQMQSQLSKNWEYKKIFKKAIKITK